MVLDFFMFVHPALPNYTKIGGRGVTGMLISESVGVGGGVELIIGTVNDKFQQRIVNTSTKDRDWLSGVRVLPALFTFCVWKWKVRW